MELSCVLIEDDNREDFDYVFPLSFELPDWGVAVACVNEDDYILGAVSYQLVDFEYIIDWLYVEPSVRRQGVGTYLIDQVLRSVVQSGDIFPVTAQFEFREDDDILHSFFLSCRIMTTTYSHERYYLSADDVRSSNALHKLGNSELTVELFFDKPIEEQKRILTMLAREESYWVTDYDGWKESCIPELCQAVYINNNLLDLIFMTRLPNGNLELSYLYGKYPKGLMELLGNTVSKVETLYPDSSLTFDAINDESRLLAQHLFPKAKTAHIYEAQF